MNPRGAARLRRLIADQLRATRGSLAFAGLCLTGMTAAELAAPWPLKILFDHVLLGHPLTPALGFLSPLFERGQWPVIALVAVAIFVLVVIAGGFAYGQIYITARLGHELAHRLRSAVFAGLQGMPLAAHERNGSGEVLVKFTADTAALKDLVADWALTALQQIVLVIGMLAIMFALNARLALVVLASLPVLGLTLALLNARIKRSLARQRRQEGQMAARVNEVLSAITMVQAFGRTAHETERFDRSSASNLADGIRTSRSTAAVARAIGLVSAAATAVTVLVGAEQVLAGRMSPGDLLVFLAYLRSLYKPLRGLGKLSVKFSRALVSAGRLADVLAEMPDDASDAKGYRPTTLAGAIEFDRVSFGYARERKVLDAVSFTVRAGERVAIVGPSGSGKSTILKLLVGLYEPTCGAIRIDGRALADYQREALRERIGIVPQEPMLFAASVRENIAYGKPDASDAQIEAAARAAHAAEFVERLAGRYDTVLAERGATLSGGERQRLCLARALVKQPAILALDEPTAAIDAHSSALIRAALEREHAGRTTIVVSHQLAEMTRFDCILVVAGGRIVETGTHDELLRARGFYARMVSLKAA